MPVMAYKVIKNCKRYRHNLHLTKENEIGLVKLSRKFSSWVML